MSVATLQTGKLAAGRKIMRALRPAEDNIDTAIIASTDLINSIIRGRMETGAALELGHDAAKRAASALARLFEAREEAVLCHQSLTIVRDSQGLSGSDLGCTTDKIAGVRRSAKAA